MSKLIVIRGNSGSGKSTISQELQKCIPNSILVEQDYFIKYVIFPKTSEEEAKRRAKIFNTVKGALLTNEIVILEGVFDSRRYKDYFTDLIEYHGMDNYFFYIDLTFEETLRRHGTREKRNKFGEEKMKEWYIPHDQLGYDFEKTINSGINVLDATRLIMQSVDETKE
jgi:thymidylate kinase